ncbi:RNA polymerase sigma-70 factor (ECF subfamily) [Salirhabdus euzebyi]|uniref:RNA polymerase sigma-70 factor (ECF subfamily) n=1 Tax=Salirhabdus euzebyi TaxID=394506 RepID=A0A841Q9H8_9BACI|nr:RNA polymerase sigma factor [Salirhabdus euzebyi]MBB6455339.1 RNA polymerase sigma-70 factor (ECF subfamily) [Salirhabdus euzebyi]
MKTDLQYIGEHSKNAWDSFWYEVEPFRNALWNYCLKLTGSAWDAEDLFQDTLLKSFASLSSLSHRQQPLKAKSFLFRVATNHWLDQCRRTSRFKSEVLNDQDLTTDIIDSVEISEAIESLLHNLTPKQVVVFVLIESFRFTAGEVADLLSTTEGAVNGLLVRARKKKHQITKTIENKRNGKRIIPTSSIKKFMELYNRQDFNGLADMLLDHASFSFVEMNSVEYGKETITKYSLNPNKLNRQKNIMVHFDLLWGKETLIFTQETEQSSLLFDINTIEWEEGKIARWKCYYFCREFMSQAAEYLGLPLAPLEKLQ